MDNTHKHKPPEAGAFRLPDGDALWIEYGFIGAKLKRVAETAARMFRADNPKSKWRFSISTLAKAAKESEKRLRKLNAEHQATDPVETVVSNEWIAKPHWVIRAAGLMVALLGILLMVPLPIIIAAGVEESLLIERVLEQPMWALAYGFAPFGAVLATHGLRDSLKSDRTRRRFDYVIYVGTLIAFGAYAWNFGPTFLIDILTDPSAAAEAGSLADFYGYHIVLEVLGAASAYSASMHMLTSGAKRVSVPNEALPILTSAIEAETRHAIDIARQRDLLAALPDTYGSAQSAYQDHAMLKTELATKLFEAQSAGETVELLTQLRSAVTPFQKGHTQ